MHLGEPLRAPSGALASGYPLHHLHAHGFAISRSVVPLLSLSHLTPKRSGSFKANRSLKPLLTPLQIAFELLQELLFFAHRYIYDLPAA
jgi:hypothetical protein